MNAFRTKNGGRIDRQKNVSFRFNNKTYSGLHGDTLASALLANGVHFVARSYKYHRPRGILSAGFEEANAIVGINRGEGRYDNNTRATTQAVFEGLEAESQNCWPSLNWDIGEINRLAGSTISAGFYYKTFMWPQSFWKAVYEPPIRKAAGLGRAPRHVDPDHYASTYAHCDVLIIGAGPAGLSAALAASKTGAKVMLADDQAEPGGDLLSSPSTTINGQNGWDWVAASLEQLSKRANFSLLPRTTAFGYYQQNLLGLVERLSDHHNSPDAELPRERLWRVRAKKVILATGAFERPLVFVGNDRPGIMLASAAKTYLLRYGVKVGHRPVVVTSGDSAYFAAFEMARAGADVGAIIDVRDQVSDHLVKQASQIGIEIVLGHTITSTSGRFRVSSISIAEKTASGQIGRSRRIECDSVLMSGGWTPSVHLFSQSRGKLDWHEGIGAFVPGEKFQDVLSAGACEGNFSLSAALNEGAAVGAQAGASVEKIRSKSKNAKTPDYETENETPTGGVSVDELKSGSRSGHDLAFVDFQHDVTSKDIRLAVREGFHSIEHIKRYTTTGMATDQGKTSNLNGLAVASQALSMPIPQVGLTTFRPPYTPTSFGALAGSHRGDLFEVTRKSPIDTWAKENGAVFEPVGLWRRARYFPKNGEDMHSAVARECKATRTSIGISDASTLGKIEVVGPDAAEFLNRIYTNPWTKLGIGRCRYGLMLGEDGYIYDDGVVGRLAHDRFHVTTTTGGAPRVYAQMEDYRQTEWPDLNVWLTSTTEQYAVIALNGPNVRKLIAPFVEGIDLDKDAFPHMAIREGTILGVPTRLFRVSFTGELGFEINVPSRFGLAVWRQLMKEGEQFDIVAYGTEALHVMRAEKGYIIVGQDTDGTQTPDDVGMNWAIGKKKPDFVGKRSLQRPDIIDENRKQLVGLLTQDPKTVLEEGAQIVAERNGGAATKMIGHVTSSYWSETLQRSIALAVVAGGRSRLGNTLYVPMPEGVHEIKVVEPIFYDPDGERLNV